MRSNFLKGIVLLSFCFIYGCDSAVESDSEAMKSRDLEVITIDGGARQPPQQSTGDFVDGGIDPSLVGAGPLENGLEYEWAENGSGEVVSYLWYDGFESDNCEGDAIVEIRVRNGSGVTSKGIFEELSEVKSVLPRSGGFCIVRTKE